MAFNGSGTYSLIAGNPVVTGTTISSTWANNTLSDIATGLTTCLTKDGQSTPTANITLGGFKITSLGAATVATDGARLSTVQNSQGTILGTIAGTNTITAQATPTLTAYASGQTFRFVPAGTNTGATTLNIDSLGAKNVYFNGVACVGGEIPATGLVQVTYDGTQFNLVTSAATSSPFSDATAIIKNSSDATKKILISAASVSAGTTRTYTGANADVTVGLPSAPKGRLTLTTAVPVTTADVTGATTLYYTPFMGNTVPIYNGSTFADVVFTELSQTTADSTKSPAAVAASKVYDIFVWSDSGTLRATRGPAWTNDTTPGTGAGTSELQIINGIAVNKVAITNGPGANLGTYVGTVRSDGSSQLNDSVLLRYVANAYNDVDRNMVVIDTTDSWTYTTLTWRQARASSANQVAYVAPQLPFARLVQANVHGLNLNSAGNDSCGVGVGVDSTSANSAQLVGGRMTNAAGTSPCDAFYKGYPGIGAHTLVWLEISVALGTTTWYGDNGATGYQQSGLIANIRS